MIPFDAAHKAVHYPPDRRFRVWIRPSFVAGAVVLILLPLLFAWGQVAIFGLPYIPACTSVQRSVSNRTTWLSVVDPLCTLL